MWSRTKSLLSLLEWAEIVEISPYLLSQTSEPANLLARSIGQCQTPFFQSGDKGSDMLGREEVAQALQDAEHLIAKILNTFPAPKQLSDTLQYPRPHNLKYGNMWDGLSGRLKSVRTNYGGILSTGVYLDTLVQANIAVTTSDPYNDTFDTAWQATVNVPVGTLESEVVVFFSSADRYDYPVEDMEIRPVSVSISGNVATIRGIMPQLITIDNYLKLVPTELNARDATIYATTIDVYRRTVDLSEAGTLIWENPVWLNCSQDAPCEVALSTSCFQATDARQGWLAPIPAVYDSDLAEYAALYPDCQIYAPSRVQVNYISGYPLVNGKMVRPLAQAVAYLATALLPNRTMGCTHADTRLFYYRETPKDDQNQFEILPEYFAYANKMFGVGGRGALRAASILMNEEYHIYRTAMA